MIQKQYSFYISSKYFKIILLIFFAIISSKLSLGQGLILERAESNVLVKLNNLVKAKQDALKDAKIQVILQAVSRFLDFESMISLKPILEKYFLEKPDYFIESVRIIKEGNTKDFSEFRIKIETQIFRSRILSTFRKLGLPISKELLTIKNVILIYNVNNELRKKRLFVEILNNLQKRLNPYRIKTKFVNNKIKFFPITSGLSDRLVFLKNKNLTENNGDTLNLLELNIKLLPKISESNKRILKAQLIYWPHNNAIQTKDESSINVKVNLNYSKWGKEKIITEILDSLMISWAPIIKKIREANKGKGQKLFLKFIGVQGPIEEQILFKTLFQNNPNWKDIFLNKISTNSVSYEGVFLGKKNKIFKNINILNLPFKISNSFWRENQVIIDTSWKEIFSNLERYQESTSENILTEIYSN